MNQPRCPKCKRFLTTVKGGSTGTCQRCQTHWLLSYDGKHEEIRLGWTYEIWAETSPPPKVEKEIGWNDKIDEVRVLIREIEKKYPDMDKIITFDTLCQDLWVLQKLLQREIKKV